MTAVLSRWVRTRFGAGLAAGCVAAAVTGTVTLTAHATNASVVNEFGCNPAPGKPYAWCPGTVYISVGDTVTWSQSNQEFGAGAAGQDNPHTVSSTSSNWSVDASVYVNGGVNQTFSHTFTAPGTYTYVCKYHLETGQVVVTSAQTGTTAPAPPRPSAAATTSARAAVAPSGGAAAAAGPTGPAQSQTASHAIPAPAPATPGQADVSGPGVSGPAYVPGVVGQTVSSAPGGLKLNLVVGLVLAGAVAGAAWYGYHRWRTLPPD